MSSEKPRILNNQRDMILSLLPLLAICLVFAGLAAQCSFAPTGPKTGKIPTVDAAAALRLDAIELAKATPPVAIRNPSVPASWTANSNLRGSYPDAERKFSRTGYVTAGSRHVQVEQTNSTEEQLVSTTFLEQTPKPRAVDGHEWLTYYEGPKYSRVAWLTDLGDARIILSGNGSPEDFELIAKALQSAQPIRPS